VSAGATTAPPGVPADVFDPMSPEVLRDPFRAYATLRERHPVGYFAPLNLWLVSRYADVHSVLGAPETFSASLAFGKDAMLTDARCPDQRRLSLRFAGEFGHVVSSSDGDIHNRLRRMIARLLSRPRLDAVAPVVDAYTREVLSVIARDRDEFDVATDLAKPVATRAIGTIIGLDEPTAERLAGWVELTFRCLDPGDPLSTVAAAAQVRRSNLAAVRAVTAALNAAVRRPPTDGPAAGLAQSWREATTMAAREEVVLSVLQLFQAGYETVVSAVCSILDEFVIGRAGTTRGPAGPAELSDLADEGLRLASPVRATMRVAVGRATVGGVPVPDGAMIMLLLGSANRDERVFERPDEALAHRSGTHLAFGAGPHRCIGRMLAHLELRQIFGVLLPAVHRIEPAGDRLLAANIIKAGYHHLPVRVRWRTGLGQ
jgi:4-methoxybenzoate monooxygenase (O-demethylating)